MRNRQRTPIARAFLIVSLPFLLTGCAMDEKNQAELKAGYKSLDEKQYDQAVAQADDFLSHSPSGQGSAEALYLKGRALEARASEGRSSNPDGDWQTARTCYVDALKQSPSRDLEAHLRAGLANVAYFQDDYATALDQWNAAYDRLDDPGIKAWILYRTGICQQRLGHFDEADRAFAATQKQFPNTLPAQRAAEHQGVRSFYVQLATYSSSTGADKAVAEARGLGVTVDRVNDAKGRQVLRVGPMATFAEARALKARVATQYPDALIVP